MLNNKIEIESNFKIFHNYITENNNSQQTLCSFAYSIPFLDITSILNLKSTKNNDYFYWKIKNEELEFLAMEILYDFKAVGNDRLRETSRLINHFIEHYRTNWEENGLNSIPLLVGGIKFAPNQKSSLWKDFSDSDWFIPRLLIYNRDNQTYLVYNFLIDSDFNENEKLFSEYLTKLESYYDYSENIHKNLKKLGSPIYSNSVNTWEVIVNKALSNISKGLLSKVVLSREVKLELDELPIISELVHELSLKYPNCYTFAYKRNNSVFFGASPEKLAKISDKWIEVDALAGSAPRGETDEEDEKLEIDLLNSKKNLFEQRAVVNFIHNLLSKISDEIIFDDKPIIRKLPNIQHLWTVIKAKVKTDFKMFDLLVRLHPTPAICGDPWKIAQDFILEMEPHDRGLYSGNIGWFNFEGSGEFAVGIRSALLKDKNLFVYAGCGIVEGSEAIAEFEESEIKLKPILSLFVDEKVYQS